MENIFMHSEWSDLCILNNNIITRKHINNEKGIYNLINNELIVNWDNWIGDDIFIYYNNYYYHKIFYNKYINNKNLIILKFYYEFKNYDIYINYDEKYLFKRFDITNIGYFEIIDNILNINWNNLNNEKIIIINKKYFNYTYINDFLDKKILYNNIDDFLKINDFENNENDDNNEYVYEDNKTEYVYEDDKNEYVYENYKNEYVYENDKNEYVYENDKNEYENIINKNYKKIEKYKKINNNFYYKSCENLNILHNENIKNNYKIIDIHIDYDKLKEKIHLLYNENIKNKNYLNIDNIKNYNVNVLNKTTFNIFLNCELNFEIPIKNSKRILSLVEWGYPPFGGGENWILNFSKIMYNNCYETFIICFSDNFKNVSFSETKLINLDYVKIIQMRKNILEIIKIIKVINPDIINHQGVFRDYFMKISNILEIPFLTGFCFWQNIIKFNGDNLNVNMINNNKLEQTEEFENILKKSYTYVSSDFVNDIIYKLYNKKLDIIETISLKEDFYVENNENKIYLTLINCHYNKGGYLLEELINNLNINIPLQLIYTENDPLITIDFLTELINKRNKKNNINILIKDKIDVKVVYNKTKIIIIPSLCDETFCRVGYESMINKIPIICSNNGNLKYLLKDYALFINNNDVYEWKNKIEELYFNDNLLNEFKTKNISLLNDKYIEKKILNKISTINDSKYKYNEKNVGLIIPWADQGLGIQGREYYISIKNICYNPFILSFKPYHATHDNIRLQTDKNEWDYENIHYSNNYREDLSYDEILDFIYKYNIKKIIIIEATYIHIFRIAMFLKLINVKIYLAINLECMRLEEIDYHYIFDKIITNNINSYSIMKSIFNDKIFNLGFHLNHNYFNKTKNILKEKTKLKFFCTGGFNSISRKNIDIIIKSFYNIYNNSNNNLNNNFELDWELNIYIQGVQIPEIIEKYKCKKINYHIINLPYKSIVDKYFEHDIFIHLGSHEGLGIGFYESIYSGTPIITMNWTPNNEIIINNENGWIIDCSSGTINDNDNSILQRAIINEENLKNKIIEILQNKNKTIKIINNTINNVNNIKIKNKKIFENNLLEILSS